MLNAVLSIITECGQIHLIFVTVLLNSSNFPDARARIPLEQMLFIINKYCYL